MKRNYDGYLREPDRGRTVLLTKCVFYEKLEIRGRRGQKKAQDIRNEQNEAILKISELVFKKMRGCAGESQSAELAAVASQRTVDRGRGVEPSF